MKQPEALGPKGPLSRRAAARRSRTWLDVIARPQTMVLVALVTLVAIGGGRRLLLARRGREVVRRLDEADIRPEDVLESAEHGREGLMSLFRLLGTSEDATIRHAAGQALAILWAKDELIAQEEQALVTRGFHVVWKARRRYPRDLRGPIPIEVGYGLPFLREAGPGVRPSQLEWSHAIEGARKASLETWSPWQDGPGLATFALDPADFRGNGPFRLALKVRARPAGLTSTWQADLPHTPFQFEFDPRLAPESLLTLEDAARAERIAAAVALETSELGHLPRFLDLNDALTLRNPPRLTIRTPLPCDLAHAVALEFEGVPGAFSAGSVIVRESRDERVVSVALQSPSDLPSGLLGRPGETRMRVVLTADPHLGWADPAVRSVWPGRIVTPWHDVEVVRR